MAGIRSLLPLFAFLLVLGPAPALGAASGSSWPDLSVPLAAGGGERDAAVVVGIEGYAFIDKVVGARANALDWYNYFVKGIRVPAASTFLLTDEQAINVQIEQTVQEALQRVKPGGTLWFVFIGHGAPGREGHDGLLVGVDAMRTAIGIQSRSVSHSKLLSMLQQGPQAHTVLVLDACYSGKNESGAALVEGLQFVVPSYSLPSGRATILTAAKADQFSGGLPGLGRPAFSYLLLGALRGWGDQDRSGEITASEAITYTRDMLLQLAKDRRQEPELLGERPDLLLGRGREPGPSLEELVAASARPSSSGPESGVATTLAGGGDYLAELEALKRAKAEREQIEKREAELRARIRAEQDRRIADARGKLLEEASTLWTASADLVRSGGPEAIQALQSYIDRYGKARVIIDDRVESLEVPQVAEAKRVLESLKKTTGSRAQGGTTKTKKGLGCPEIVNMVRVNVPTTIVVRTIQDSGASFGDEDIRCLREAGVPAEVLNAARAKQAPQAP